MRLWHLLKHLGAPAWLLRRRFGRAAQDTVAAAIGASEKRHRGEICVVVEAALPFAALRAGLDSRTRAEQLFRKYEVDRTREASGILVYVQLLDRRLEILADRGIAERVATERWAAICHEVEREFAAETIEKGLLLAVDRIGALLAEHFPAGDDNPDELPNRPRVL